MENQRYVAYQGSDISTKRNAIRFAMNNNIDKIFDTETKVVTDVPSPQRSGTMSQQASYINQVVERMTTEPENWSPITENPCKQSPIELSVKRLNLADQSRDVQRWISRWIFMNPYAGNIQYHNEKFKEEFEKYLNNSNLDEGIKRLFL